MFWILGLIAALGAIGITLYGVSVIYNILHPVESCRISPRFIRFGKKLYIITRFGWRWIVEKAEAAENGDVQWNCVMIEGSPPWSFFRQNEEDIAMMQRKLGEYLSEHHKEMQVIEIMIPKERR